MTNIADKVDQEERDYRVYLDQVNFKFQDITVPMFETDARRDWLWEQFIAAFPAEDRQFHNCTACRHFVKRYGHIAYVDDKGRLRSALWDAAQAPENYRASIHAMQDMVEQSRIVAPWVSDETEYGEHQNLAVSGQIWHHLYVLPTRAQVYVKKGLTEAHQERANKVQAFPSIQLALKEYPLNIVIKAKGLLEAQHLVYDPGMMAQLQFLIDLHQARNRNEQWAIVAPAPEGFCHPRDSAVGTLMDDLIAGLEFSSIKARWDAKLDPLKFKRAQAAPKVGAVLAAEKGFAALGAESSLFRRYATDADIKQKIWLPRQAKAEKAIGIFASVKVKGVDPVSELKIDMQSITWDKFRRTVLPGALGMTFKASLVHREHYVTLTAAVDPESRPVLQWDEADDRNTVALFGYERGATGNEFGLNGWTKVTSVVEEPHQWQQEPNIARHGMGAIFVLENAVDRKNASGQSAIFYSNLRSEYHPFRQVLEAYSQANALQEGPGPHVCGVHIGSQDKSRDIVVRVVSEAGIADYKIDRWD